MVDGSAASRRPRRRSSVTSSPRPANHRRAVADRAIGILAHRPRWRRRMRGRQWPHRRRGGHVARCRAGTRAPPTRISGPAWHAYHARMAEPTSTTFDLVVIGGGPAGVTAALRGAELGARVALVERDRPGGTCTDDGCAPTRVLAKAARLVRDAEQLAAYGLSAPPPTLDLRGADGGHAAHRLRAAREEAARRSSRGCRRACRPRPGTCPVRRPAPAGP